MPRVRQLHVVDVLLVAQRLNIDLNYVKYVVTNGTKPLQGQTPRFVLYRKCEQ